MLYSFLLIYLFREYGANRDYGIYVFSYSIVSILSDIFCQNSVDSTLFFLRTKNASLKGVIRIAIKWDIFFGLLLLIISYFGVHFLGNNYKENIVFLTSIIATKIFVINLRNFVFIDLIHGNLYSHVYIIKSLENLLLLVVFLVSFTPELESILLMELLIAVAITILAIMYFIVFRKRRLSARGVSISIRDFSRHAYKLFVVRTVKISTRKLDNILMGIFGGPEFLAIYDKLKKFVLPLDLVTNPYRELYYPKILQYRNLDDTNGLVDFIWHRSLNLAKVVLPLLLAIFLLKNLYFDFAGINLNSTVYIVFSLLLFQALANSVLWWAKSFSNAWNPFYSLRANLMVLFGLVVMSLIASYYGVIAFVTGMFVNTVLVLIFWYVIIIKLKLANDK